MKERLKTAVILFLLALMGFQFWFSVNMGLISGGDPVEEDEPGTIGITAAAVPRTVAVASDEGVSCGFGEDQSALLQKCEPVLREAVGSMGSLSPASGDEVFGLLSGNALFIKYNRSFPISLICAWAGGACAENTPANTLIAAEKDGAVVLAIASEGGWLTAPTSASPERLREAASGEVKNAAFSREGDGFSVIMVHMPVYGTRRGAAFA